MATHECVFVEEQEPSGRLVLPPCIVCGCTAMDALLQEREETRQAYRDFQAYAAVRPLGPDERQEMRWHRDTNG